MTESKSCILISRVSTYKQDFEAQKQDLELYAQKLGFNNFIHISNTESGFKTIERKEGFKEVEQIINNNSDCRTIICTELSRLSRKESVLHYIKEYLLSNNIQLYVKDINFALFDSNGNVSINSAITFSVFSAMASEEMRQKQLRFKREKERLGREGYSISGKTLFGYTRSYDTTRKKNTYIINEVEAAEILDVYNKYISDNIGIKDLTLYCIAKNYSKYLHNKRNVTKLLSEEAYKGFKITNNSRKNSEYWNYGDTKAPKYIKCSSELKYPRIMSDELFEAVQRKKLENNTNVDKSNKHITLLSKLIRCHDCGRFLTANYRTRGSYIAHSYRCTKRNNIVNCSFKGAYSMPLLDSIVWSLLKNNIREIVSRMQETDIEKKLETLDNEIQNLNLEYDKYEEERDKATIIFKVNYKGYQKENVLAEYEKSINEINKNEAEIKKQIAKREQNINQLKSIEGRNWDSDIISKIQEIAESKELLYKYIHDLIKEVKVLYNSQAYMVVKVDVLTLLGYRMVFDDNINSKEVKDYITYYVFVDKHDNHRIKLRTILRNDIAINGKYIQINEETMIPISNVFELNIDNRDELILKLTRQTISELKQNSIYLDIEDLEYNRLDIY